MDIRFSFKYNNKNFIIKNHDIFDNNENHVYNDRINKYLAEYILSELQAFNSSSESIFSMTNNIIKEDPKYDSLNNVFYKFNQVHYLSKLAISFRSKSLNNRSKILEKFISSVNRVKSSIFYSYPDFDENKNNSSILIEIFLASLNNEKIYLYNYYSYHEFLDIFKKTSKKSLETHYNSFNKEDLLSLVNKDFKNTIFLKKLSDCFALRIKNYNSVLKDIAAYDSIKPKLDNKKLLSLTKRKTSNLLDRENISYNAVETIWGMISEDIKSIPDQIKKDLSKKDKKDLTQSDLLRLIKSELLVPSRYRQNNIDEKKIMLLKNSKIDNFLKLFDFIKNTKTGIEKWSKTNNQSKMKILDFFIKKDKNKEFKDIILNNFEPNLNFYLSYNVSSKLFFLGLEKNSSKISNKDISRLLKHKIFKNLKLKNKIIFSQDLSDELIKSYSGDELVSALYDNIVEEKYSLVLKRKKKSLLDDSFLLRESKLIKKLEKNKMNILLDYYHWSFSQNEKLINEYEKQLRKSDNFDLIARLSQSENPKKFFDFFENKLSNDKKVIALIKDWDDDTILEFFNYINQKNKEKIIKEAFLNKPETFNSSYYSKNLQEVITKDEKNHSLIRKTVLNLNDEIFISMNQDLIKIFKKEDWVLFFENPYKYALEGFLKNNRNPSYKDKDVQFYRKVFNQFSREEIESTNLFKYKNIFEKDSFYSHPIIIKYGSSFYEKEKNLNSIIMSMGFYRDDFSFIYNNIDVLDDTVVTLFWNVNDKYTLKDIKKSINHKGVRSNKDREKLNLIKNRFNKISACKEEFSPKDFNSTHEIKNNYNTEKMILSYLFKDSNRIANLTAIIKILSRNKNLYLKKRDLFKSLLQDLLPDREKISKIVGSLFGDLNSLSILNDAFKISSSEKIHSFKEITKENTRFYNRERNYSFFEKLESLDFLCDEQTIKENDFTQKVLSAIPYDPRHRRSDIRYNEDEIAKDIIKRIVSTLRDNDKGVDRIISKLNLSKDKEIKIFMNKIKFMNSIAS